MKKTSMNFIRRSTPSEQKGLGMVEIMIGLAIFVTFVAAILTLGRSLLGQTDVTTASMDHKNLVNGIQSMYRLDNDYVGLTNTVLWNNGPAIPDTMRGVTPTRIMHEWSAADTNDVAVTVGPTDDTFLITYLNIPGDMCAGFVTGTYRDADSVTVGGQVVTNATEIGTECDGTVKPIAYVYF